MSTRASGRANVVDIFDYDFDDLAQQVQTGLERLAINFLRGHGATMRRDVVDFHGYEQVGRELEPDGHALGIHQVGPPRGPGVSTAEAGPAALEVVFESTFDGWPSK